MSAGSGLSAALRVPEFRALWSAELLSVGGDQLARVALAVLVYGRTGSPGWAAATYALTFLPALLGGVLLSWPADRYRRREVMVAADLMRAVLAATMAVPGLPLGALCAALVLLVLLGSPFTAAQGALLPTILPGDLYEKGLAVRQMTGQAVQLAGFAAGGLLAAASPAAALLADAGTFLLSALLLRTGLADRPRPAPEPAGESGTGAAAAIAGVLTDPRRRALVLLTWLVGWYVVPEALAAPYADQLGFGSASVGLLMAADPLGSVVGAWLFLRFVPEQARIRLIGVLACCAGLPLILCALRPGLPLTLLLWALSGLASTGYLLQAQASFVRATADADRGRAIGFAASGLIAAQGVTIFAGGLFAERWDPAAAVAVAGAVGAGLALVGAVSWERATGADRRRPAPA
jgi:MFS family permease